ncbi:DUF3368 domain-containing protein [Candidatus Poribacteria bacterium]|nr:DUF3368 domain-containing protein [Candidatus Poribacteria bacterium]
MQEKPVILNNTPLVALWSLDQLSLLRELYTEVWIPLAVKAEFLEINTIVRQESLDNAPWIKTVRLTHPQRAVYAGLHHGEASVLALAEEHNARLVIIDELKARRYAQQIGLQVTGTIGVLLLAKERGLIDAIQPPIKELQAHGLYLSSALIDKALQLAGETQ